MNKFAKNVEKGLLIASLDSCLQKKLKFCWKSLEDDPFSGQSRCDTSPEMTGQVDQGAYEYIWLEELRG